MTPYSRTANSLVISLLMLPLIVWLKNGAGARLLAGLAGWLARPGAIYLLALPVAAFTSFWSAAATCCASCSG